MGNYFRLLKNVDVEKEILARFNDWIIQGDNYLVFCCFHDNKNTPSLGINKRTGIFGCYSCGESGNFFELLSHVDDRSVDSVIDSFSIKKEKALPAERDVPKDIQSLVLNKLKREGRKKKTKTLKEGFLSQFKTDRRAYSYLLNRGVSVRTSKIFNIRWGGDSTYWKSRVIFSVFNKQGRLVSISGRHITDNSMQNKMRHMFGSQQRMGLFGYQQAKTLIKEQNLNFVVVAEGQVDCMSLYEAGVPSVAVGKMVLSDEQASMVASIADIAILGMDDDAEEKNKKAIPKMKAKLEDFMVTIRVVPEKHDWNELLCYKGKASIKRIFKKYGVK